MNATNERYYVKIFYIGRVALYPIQKILNYLDGVTSKHDQRDYNFLHPISILCIQNNVRVLLLFFSLSIKSNKRATRKTTIGKNH